MAHPSLVGTAGKSTRWTRRGVSSRDASSRRRLEAVSGAILAIHDRVRSLNTAARRGSGAEVRHRLRESRRRSASGARVTTDRGEGRRGQQQAPPVASQQPSSQHPSLLCMILTSPLDSLCWAWRAGTTDRQEAKQPAPAGGDHVLESSRLRGSLDIGLVCGDQELGHQVHRSSPRSGIEFGS